MLRALSFILRRRNGAVPSSGLAGRRAGLAGLRAAVPALLGSLARVRRIAMIRPVSVVRHGGQSPSKRNHFAIFKVQKFEELRAELGFETADAVMRELAGRLSDVFVHSDICRIGRTTLEIAVDVEPDRLQAQLTCARLHLQRPLVIDGLEVALGITCGAAALDPARPLSESIHKASGALVRGQASRSCISISSDDGPRADTMGNFQLARALKAALDAQELQLFYQPKLHCRDDEIRSVEALLRWTHRDLGPMPIDRVIVAAESTGVIRSLTDWVVKRASIDAAILADAGREVTVFVNLSARLIADRAYVGRLIDQVTGAGRRIGFEITETAVIDDPEDAIANVTAMSRAGIRIAIDDYGSGLSSLAYLKRLPAHELKIDQMFIRDLIQSHRDPLLVRSSIDLAHALEMEVTAEGVDDPMIMSLLRIMGCDIVQGYLIARPLPLPELIAFLQDAEGLRGLGRAPHSLPGWDAITGTEPDHP